MVSEIVDLAQTIEVPLMLLTILPVAEKACLDRKHRAVTPMSIADAALSVHSVFGNVLSRFTD